MDVLDDHYNISVIDKRIKVERLHQWDRPTNERSVEPPSVEPREVVLSGRQRLGNRKRKNKKRNQTTLCEIIEGVFPMYLLI